MKAIPKTSDPKHRKLLIVAATSLAILAAIGVLLILTLKNNYPPKERVEELALSTAKEYCANNKQFEPAYCDTLTIAETKGPVDYGPTDGRDEYTGNWFVTTKFDSRPNSLIYVVTNFAGDIQYINTTGQNEYPYCKNGYAVYPEEPEKNGKVRCGYYKE